MRSLWTSIDVTKAGWPVLAGGTYYWVALTPGTTLTLPNGQFNGVMWTGIYATAGLPPSTTSDPNLFTGRELSSQRFATDAAFSSTSVASLALVTNTTTWAAVPSTASRYKNWQATGSNIRYGIQIIGWQVTPSNTPSPSRECRGRGKNGRQLHILDKHDLLPLRTLQQCRHEQQICFDVARCVGLCGCFFFCIGFRK
jgi:hypothetical protein